MEKLPLPLAEDDSDRKLLSDIARVGWHLVGISEDEDGPAYVFSEGLYHTFDQPEIMIVGLGTSTAGHLINAIGERMKSGYIFETPRQSPVPTNRQLCSSSVKRCSCS